MIKINEPKPEEILKDFSGHNGSLINNLSDDDILTEFEIEETHEMVQEWIKNGWYVPPPKPSRQRFPPSSNDQPVNNLTKQMKKVKFADKPKNAKSRDAAAQAGWPSKSKQTQTSSWSELLKAEWESDQYYDQLFNKSDTEHDSEDTIVSN